MPIIAAPQQLTTFLDIAEALTSKKKTEAAIAEIRKAVRELEDAQMALKAMQENASKLGKADKILADAQVHEQKVSVRERELNERTAELDKTIFCIGSHDMTLDLIAQFLDLVFRCR